MDEELDAVKSFEKSRKRKKNLRILMRRQRNVWTLEKQEWLLHSTLTYMTLLKQFFFPDETVTEIF